MDTDSVISLIYIYIYTYMLHKCNYIYIYDAYKHVSDDAESNHCLEKEKYWFHEK